MDKAEKLTGKNSRLDEIDTKSAELKRLANRSDEQVTELTKLSIEKDEISVEIRKLNREIDEERRENSNVEITAGQGEEREFRSVLAKRDEIVGEILASGKEQRSVTGALAEINAKAGVENTPGNFAVDVFSTYRKPEERADAITAAPTTAGSTPYTLRDPLGLIKRESGVISHFGIRTDVQDSGSWSGLKIDSRPEAKTVTSGTSIESTGGTLSGITRDALRLGVSLSMRKQAQIKSPQTLNSLLPELARAIAYELDDNILLGDGVAAAGVTSFSDGLLGGETLGVAPADPTAAIAVSADATNGAAGNTSFYDAVDFIYATDFTDCRFMLGGGLIKHLMTIKNATTDLRVLSELKEIFGAASFRATNRIKTDQAADKAEFWVARRGNHGGYSVVVWRSIQLLFDPYTSAKSATDHWRLNMYANAAMLRADEFLRGIARIKT